MSIRILSYIGTKYAQDYVTQNFGFDADKTPPYLPMALGAGLVTPLQMAGAYSVFANGGYRINPYLIAEVTDPRGTVVSHAAAARRASETRRTTIEPRNAYVMNSLLHSVAQRGTGAKTNVLKRNDLQARPARPTIRATAGSPAISTRSSAIAWIGYDKPRSLGDKETGGGLALPVWIDYMGRALRGVPE